MTPPSPTPRTNLRALLFEMRVEFSLQNIPPSYICCNCEWKSYKNHSKIKKIKNSKKTQTKTNKIFSDLIGNI